MTTKNAERRGYFDSVDGMRLYAEHDPVDTPRSRLIFVHGFAEHCGRYRDMCAQFVAAGHACHRFDMRGHGNAGGRRGHIFAFADYVNDLRAFRERVDARFPVNCPTFIVAHSNGGLVTLNAMIDDQTGIDGLALSSPFFDFAIKVPGWKKFLGHQLSRFIPALSLPTDIPASHVSRDPATIQEYATDPLINKVATARWLTETESAMERVRARAGEVELPVLIQQAGKDKIADGVAARQIFDLMGGTDKTWTLYDELYHEVYFETERQAVYDDLLSWLDARAPKV